MKESERARVLMRLLFVGDDAISVNVERVDDGFDLLCRRVDVVLAEKSEELIVLDEPTTFHVDASKGFEEIHARRST